MAIALPPPPTPQQGNLAELRAQATQGSALDFDYKGVKLRVFGPLLLPRERLDAAVRAAATLSDAVRAVGSSYYLAGYPATLVTYAADQSAGVVVYVHVVPAKVSEVRGPPALLPYFDDLPRRAPLSDTRLETDRAAADVLAVRSGASYKPQFTPTGADAVALDLGTAGEGEHRFDAAASLNNYGNRYAGPYLASLGLRLSLSSGDEFQLSGAAALRLLGLGGEHAGPYHEGDAGWSHATTLGVFGVQGRYADFQETASGVTFQGRLHEVALDWQATPYASLRQRLSVEARVLHDHQALGQPQQTVALSCDPLTQLLQQLGLAACQSAQGGGDAYSETYNSAELSLGWAWRSLELNRPLELKAGALARKGFSGGRAFGTGADLGYFLWQPSLSLRWQFLPQWSLLAAGSAQLGSDLVPQQQQDVIGGPSNLHAFLAGAGVGDRGHAAALSLLWNGEEGGWAARWNLRPRLFAEYASATHLGSALGEPAGKVRLADAGAALDLGPVHGLLASFSVGRPVLKQGAQQSPDQLQSRLFYFQVAARY